MNPTFDPIARPGAYHERLVELARSQHGDGPTSLVLDLDDRTRYGQLEPIASSYRERDARLAAMDDQGVERTFLFPTMGVCVEGLLTHDPLLAHDAFHAFNLWLDDDWGYSHRDRLYAAPHLVMLDPDLLVTELELVLSKGAKVISLRPGPAAGRSPADPLWHRFWGLVNEAGVLVAYHAYGGPTDYHTAFEQMWGRAPVADHRYNAVLANALISDRGILDTVVSLTLGNVFGRFPNVRIASVELGSAWLPYALHILDHAGGLLDRRIEAFGTRVADRPSDIVKEHVYVSPFPEEDVVGLTEFIGVDRVLFGSDWPHPEGNVRPADYATCIATLDPAEVRKIMRDNALSLVS